MWIQKVSANKNLVTLLLSAFVIVYSTSARAHFPILSEKDATSRDPQILQRPYHKSVAIYTRFENPRDVDVYQFSVEENDLGSGSLEIFVGTVVPACEPLKDLLLTLAVVGPQQQTLPSPLSPEVIEAMGSKGDGINRDEGMLLITNLHQGSVWREPYTDHWYFMQKRLNLKLQRSGTYQILVWAPKGMTGDYVFEFGDREIWRIGDILHTLWLYPTLLFEREIRTPNCTTNSMQQHTGSRIDSE